MAVSYGLSSILFGLLSRRFKLRLFALLVLFSMAIGYALLSSVSKMWQIAVIYTLLFGIGQTGLQVSQTLIARWFIARRGMAFAIAACGLTLAGAVIAPALTYFIKHVGFSTATTTYAVIIALFIPLVAVFLKEWPEAVGLKPDWGKFKNEMPNNSESENISLQSLLRKPLFWSVGLVVALSPLILGQLMTYLIPMAHSNGVDMQIASFFLSGLALAGLVGKITSGWIADKMPLRLLTALPLCGYIVSCGLFLISSNSWLFGGSSLLAGVSGGISSVMIALAIAKTFGRNAFATIAGFIAPIGIVFSFLTTWACGKIIDLTGNYSGVLYILIGLSIISILISIFFIGKQDTKGETF